MSSIYEMSKKHSNETKLHIEHKIFLTNMCIYVSYLAIANNYLVYTELTCIHVLLYRQIVSTWLLYPLKDRHLLDCDLESYQTPLFQYQHIV